MLLDCWGDPPRPPWGMSSASLRRNTELHKQQNACCALPAFPWPKPSFLLFSKPLLGTLSLWQLGSGCTDLLVILQGIFISESICFCFLSCEAMDFPPSLHYFIWCFVQLQYWVLCNAAFMNTRVQCCCVLHTHERGRKCSLFHCNRRNTRSNLELLELLEQKLPGAIRRHCCEKSRFLPPGWPMNRKVWGFERGYRRARGFGVIATEWTPNYFFLKSALCLKVLRWGGDLHFWRVLTGMELIDPEKWCRLWIP